jgi:SAM-dependent methyltransferase
MIDTTRHTPPDSVPTRTADHYSKQWGKEFNFQGFVEANPEAAMVLPGRQLGWPDLFDRIRSAAAERPTTVYDAGCGFGDVARRLLADPIPMYIDYLGADIHGSLGTIDAPSPAKFIQADMSHPLPGARIFDFIVCRAALHHTPDPVQAYNALSSQLARGGTLAVSVYAKKAPMREATDDALRARVVPMSNDEAMAVADQFTRLGRDLQASNGTITIVDDIPFLGIAFD